MSSASKKIKTGLDWIEHGKTILDVVAFLVSAGGGSAVRAFFSQSTSIPNAWLTTIWILSTAGILWLLTLLFPKKLVQERAEAETHVPIPSRTSRLMPLLIVGVIAFAAGRYSADTRPTPNEWAERRKSLEPEIHKLFANQEIELDGKRFENSTFQNVTLIYRGLKPYEIANNHIGTPLVIKVVDGPQGDGASFMEMFYELCRGHESNCDIRGVTFHIVDEQLKQP